MKAQILMKDALVRGKINGVIHGKGTLHFLYVVSKPAIKYNEGSIYCNRCHYPISPKEGNLQIKEMFFCPYCLSFGRLTTNDYIYYLPFHPILKGRHYLEWSGQLSIFQKKISDQLVKHCLKEKELMVYAVTGAGKTEVIFAYIDQLLYLGCRVAYVAPRIDVVLEIGERLRQAFPTLDIPILYKGHRAHRFCRLYASTVHQLVHFHHCFDVIIIDEVDAYPYYGNPYLEHLVHKALTPTGQRLYLSATLTEAFAVKIKTMPVFYLSIRYHQFPLPVPKIVFLWNSDHYYYTKYPPMILEEKIKRRQRPILFFVPSTYQLKAMYHQLCRWFPKLNITSVYSQDPLREEKIKKMRQTPYDILITTTILERGVTFKNIDVYIFNAHHQRFTRQVLVQISGRAGRKKEAPKGEVIWFSTGWTKEMKEALRLIKKANKEREELIDE